MPEGATTAFIVCDVYR